MKQHSAKENAPVACFTGSPPSTQLLADLLQLAKAARPACASSRADEGAGDFLGGHSNAGGVERSDRNK